MSRGRMSAGAAGFTLSELLVALALGGVLLAAVLGAAAAMGRRHSELEQLSRLRERADHALGLLEPEVQLAGYGGLAPMASWAWPAALPEGANSCGTLDRAPSGSRSALRVDLGFALPCAAHGGGAADSSDVLTVLRAGTRPSVPSEGRLQVATGRTAGSERRVLADGRLSPTFLAVDGLDELRDLELQSFYVSKDSDGFPGLPALRIKALTAIDGRASFVDQELVAGVEMLCVETGMAVTAEGLSFAHSPVAYSPSELPPALRISLLMRSEKPWGLAREQSFACADRQLRRHDAYLRHLRARTWAVRNARTPQVSP